MNVSDHLRSQLPRITGELAESIEVALQSMRGAMNAQNIAPTPAQSAAWKKGVADALGYMRPAQDALEQFQRWLKAVVAQEVDECGLTLEERSALLRDWTANLDGPANLSSLDLSNVGATMESDATNFTAQLLRLIAKADPVNRLRLRIAFPEAVNAWEKWSQGGYRHGA